MPDRVFTEEEVKAIIRRATERQEEEAEHAEARQHGLTLADLEQLGTEVGLDPKHLRAAADELRSGRPVTADAETRTDTHVIVERRIGVPFTPEAWEDTVALLRQRFGMDMGMWYGGSGTGRVEQVGRAHEWVHVSQLGVETRVSTSDRERQTRLILSQRVGQASSKVEGAVLGAIAGLLIGAVGGSAVGSAFGGGLAFLLAFVAITLVTALTAAPLITRHDRRWREKKLRGLKELAAEIEGVFEAVSPEATERSTRAVEAERPAGADGRIDLDRLPDEADEPAPAERHRTRS